MSLVTDSEVLYDLSFENKPATLKVALSLASVDVVKKLLMPGVPRVDVLKQQLNLLDFIPPTEKVWGYGKFLEWSRPNRKGWITLACKLPVVIRGERVSQLTGLSISASFGALFAALACVDKVETGEPRQLVAIEFFNTGTRLYGCSLLASLTPRFVSWLSTEEETHHWKEVAAAMAAAYFALWPGSRKFCSEKSDFRPMLRKPYWVHLDVPGNACGLDPEGHDFVEEGYGYELVPHNTDSAIQQLTLLAGLARLNQMARADGF